jgi:mRNA-degrading endonuclease RelE of RelBE toxin-antitoxin system
MMSWDVSFTSRAEKQARNLPPDVREILFALVLEITKLGPTRTFWPNYGNIKGKKDCYHCHLKKGKPTYVAVWKIIDKKNKLVEVRYVGTHEKADYGRFC